jgi:hypothetical protein
MREIFFVIKTFIITLVFVLLLQIKLGDDTLEVRALTGLRQSEAATFLQEFGADGWSAFRKTAAQLTHSLSQIFSSREDRSSFFKFGRSQAYQNEQSQKALPEKTKTSQ